MERISSFTSEEKSVPFARMVDAITTWINPQGETLTACCISAVLQGRLQGDPGPGWSLQRVKEESGLETYNAAGDWTRPSHHNMSQGINNMLEKFSPYLHICTLFRHAYIFIEI